MSKEIAERKIKNHLLDYLKFKDIKLKKIGKLYTFECPFCGGTTNTLPHNKSEANCQEGCKKYYTVLDYARKLDNLEDKEDSEVFQNIKEQLKLEITTTKELDDIYDILDFYHENGWDLLPLVKEKKIPIQGMKWRDSEHKNINEWKDWLDKDLNLAVKTGITSNITIIDIDALTKKEKIEIRSGQASKERLEELKKKRKENIEKVKKELGDLGNPLIQVGVGGEHLIYKYVPELPKTGITLANVHVDIENDGGYVVIYPSKLPNSKRFFKDFHNVSKMPENIKKVIKENSKTIRKTDSEEIADAIKNENFKIKPEDLNLINNNLEGCCNNTFIKLGGILRKKLNLENTSYVMNILNQHLLENPMPNKDIRAMIRELSKYNIFDESELADKIIEYLRDVEESSRNEIAMAVVGTNRGEDKKRVDKALTYLVNEEKLIKKGKYYALPKEIEWETSLIEDVGKPINFKIPYFYDIANFRFGDLVLIGSQNKIGKTTIALNILKQISDQNVIPHYISLEPGSRFKDVALKLGMKEGDFRYNKKWVDPTHITLKKNAVTIVDWLMIKDKSKTDLIFQRLIEELYKTHGLLIVFMQLKSAKGQENEWFASNMVSQFPAFTAKYIYDSEDSGEFGYFSIGEVRDPKLSHYPKKLPCQYDWESKTLTRIDEKEREENNG